MAFVGFAARKGALLSSSAFLRRSTANTRLVSSLLQNSRATRIGAAPFAFRSLSTSNSSPNPASAESTPLVEAATDVDLDTASFLSDSVDTVAASLPPLQLGDFNALGLGGWSPPGLVESTMELINVTTGMPWIWTIVAGTVVWRIACLPFVIIALRTSARMQPHQAATDKLRQDIQAAAKSKNPLQVMRAQAAQREFNQKHGINPLGSLAGLIQLPVTFGTFFAVRHMAILPVEQLKESGLALIPDLTAPDPTMMMPVLLCAAVNWQMSVAGRDMMLETRPAMGHIMNLLRAFSVFSIYVMSNFSAALMVSLLTTSTFTLLQTIILQRPSIRLRLDIPLVPQNARKLPSPLESLLWAKKSYNEFIEEGKLQQQQQRRK